MSSVFVVFLFPELRCSTSPTLLGMGVIRKRRVPPAGPTTVLSSLTFSIWEQCMKSAGTEVALYAAYFCVTLTPSPSNHTVSSFCSAGQLQVSLFLVTSFFLFRCVPDLTLSATPFLFSVSIANYLNFYHPLFQHFSFWLCICADSILMLSYFLSEMFPESLI